MNPDEQARKLEEEFRKIEDGWHFTDGFLTGAFSMMIFMWVLLTWLEVIP